MLQSALYWKLVPGVRLGVREGEGLVSARRSGFLEFRMSGLLSHSAREPACLFVLNAVQLVWFYLMCVRLVDIVSVFLPTASNSKLGWPHPRKR